MDLDANVRLAVYQHFASTTAAPSLTQVAAACSCAEQDVRASYARLRANRVLLLEPDGETIRMAPPFSGVPTQHRVEVGPRTYFANCAWDAFGIPAAFQQEGVVRSSCGQSGAPLDLAIGPAGPAPSDWLFHCQVPAARWWADLVFT